MGAERGVPLDRLRRREGFPAIGRAREGDFFDAGIAHLPDISLTTSPSMFIGPYNLEFPPVRPVRAVNGDPGFVVEDLVLRAFKDVDRVAEGAPVISGGRDRDTAHAPLPLEHHDCIDLIVCTEGEGDICGECIALLEAGEDATIRPGTATIERDKIAIQGLILRRIGEEFGATDQVERVVRIFHEHWLAVCLVVIMADAYVDVRRLQIRPQPDAGATASQGIGYCRRRRQIRKESRLCTALAARIEREQEANEEGESSLEQAKR